LNQTLLYDKGQKCVLLMETHERLVKIRKKRR